MNKTSETDALNYHKTLEVLKEIERNPQQTQRVLAQRLNISLGKMNFLINSLIDKGIIEARNFTNSNNKFSYIYLLTPRGIRIKLNLARKFFIWKMQEYERLKQEIKELKKKAPLLNKHTKLRRWQA